MYKVFWKDVGRLAAGNFSAQIIMALTTPLLARFFYADGDFGGLGILLAWLGPILALCSFSINHAFVIENGGMRSSLQNIYLSSLCFFTLVLICLVNLGPQTFTDLTLLPLLLFSAGIHQYCLSSLRSVGDFKLSSRVAIFTGFITAATQLAIPLFLYLFSSSQVLFLSDMLSLFPPGAKLIFGVAIGFLSGALYAIKKSTCSLSPKGLSLIRLRAAATKHWRFIFLSTPTKLLGFMLGSSIIFLVTDFGGLAGVGAYFLASKIIGVQNGILWRPLGEVFEKTSHDMRGNIADLIKMYKLFLCCIFFILLPLTLAISFSMPWVCYLLFGEGRELAGYIAQVRLPAQMLLGASVCAHVILRNFAWQGVSIGIVSASYLSLLFMWLAGQSAGFKGAILASSVASCFFATIWLVVPYILLRGQQARDKSL